MSSGASPATVEWVTPPETVNRHRWLFCSLAFELFYLQNWPTYESHIRFFFWKLVQWKPRTGLILLAFPWISAESQLHHLLNRVLLLSSFQTMLAYEHLTILVEHGWCYGVWRTKKPLLEVIEFYSHGVLGDANPTFTIDSLWKSWELWLSSVLGCPL